MDKFMEMSLLLDFYGSLLSERQQMVAKYSYDQDLSLTEVGAIMGISKQAVADTLKRADQALLGYEESLGLKARFLFMEEEISEIVEELDQVGEEIPSTEAMRVQGLTRRLRGLLSEGEPQEGENL